MSFTRRNQLNGPHSDHRHEIDAASILSDCGESKTHSRLIVVNTGQTLPSQFESVEERRVQIRVDCDLLGRGFVPNALVCLSFPHKESLCAFLACIVDIRIESSNRIDLFIEKPERLTVVNLRRSFRVPVVSQSGLRVQIRLQDQLPTSVEPLNIAETGIEFDFHSSNIPEALQVGALIEVQLDFRSEQVNLKAEIRRYHDTCCAVMFLSSLDSSSHSTATRLHEIVFSLQQLWLKSRLH